MKNFRKFASFPIFFIVLISLTRVTRSSFSQDDNANKENKPPQEEGTSDKPLEADESSKNNAVPSGSASVHEIQSAIDPPQNTNPQETDTPNDKSKKNETADTTQPSNPQLTKSQSVKKTKIPQNVLDFLNEPKLPEEDRLDTDLPQKGQGNNNATNNSTDVKPGVPQDDRLIDELSQKDLENRSDISQKNQLDKEAASEITQEHGERGVLQGDRLATELPQNDKQNEEAENKSIVEKDLTFTEVFEEYHRYMPYMVQREETKEQGILFFPAYELKIYPVRSNHSKFYTRSAHLKDFIHDFNRRNFYDWSFSALRQVDRLIPACPEKNERTIEFSSGVSPPNTELFEKPLNVIENAFSTDDKDKVPSSPQRSNSKKGELANQLSSDQSPNQSDTESPPSSPQTTQPSNPLNLASVDSSTDIASSSNPFNSASAGLSATMQSPVRSDSASANSISDVALSRNPSNSASADLPLTAQSPAQSNSPAADSPSIDESSKLTKSPSLPNSPKGKKSKKTISENFSAARKYFLSTFRPSKKNDSKDKKTEGKKPPGRLRPRPQPRPQPPPPIKNKFKGRVLKAEKATKDEEYVASRYPCTIPLEPSFVKEEKFTSVDVFFAGYMIDFPHEKKVTPMITNLMQIYDVSKKMVWFPVAHLMRHKDTKDTYAIFNHAPTYEFGAEMKHVPIYTDYTVDENGHAYGKAEYYDQMYSEENQKSVFNAIPDGPKYFDPNNSLKLVPQELMDQKSVLPMTFKRVALNYMNIAPMFEKIRNTTWRNLENVVLKLPMVTGYSTVMFITGVYGEFKINDEPVYLDNGSNDDGMKRIKVPYAFYKVVNIVYSSPKINAFFPESLMFSFSIIIFTHNNPFEKDPEKICDEPVDCKTFGWTKVVQNDPAFGFTYCCKFTKELATKLEIDFLYGSIKHQYLLDLRLLWYVEENRSTNSLAIDDKPPLLVKSVELNVDLSKIPSTNPHILKESVKNSENPN
ncbi:uncharacterized protein LOC135848827 [Planococcus citri]|uniref:uncharacterized protein LOC135848827 n=1 Tax=Planococcus citri TaxID=170843 RepID=UPI0031F97AA6